MQNTIDSPSPSTAIAVRTNDVDAPAPDVDGENAGGHPGVSCFRVLFLPPH